MEILWFLIVAVMLTVYVVLDGFDLGCGALHLYVARNETERQQVIRSIGPVWDGNEVWLLAAGGVLFLAFPILYASSFSGFYLPLMIVLWLLVGRGISVELRNHIDSPLWKPLWDVVFMVSSGLLAVFLGAALGNVVRGVPLESSRYFFLPLWTDFGFGENGLTGSQVGVLDWYTILVGILALLTLLVHGSKWLVLKTEGDVRVRAKKAADTVWWGVGFLLLVVTLATFQIQPQVLRNFGESPWGFLFPAMAVAGLVGIRLFRKEEQALGGFLASALFIVGMLTSVAFGIFPYVLPASTDPQLGLTVYNAATGEYGLKVALLWWIPGMILATFYFVYTYSKFSGKVDLTESGY